MDNLLDTVSQIGRILNEQMKDYPPIVVFGQIL